MSYQGGAYPSQQERAPIQPARLTLEEQRVLKECNRESFYQRCLPFMACLGSGTYYAIKAGHIQAGLGKWPAAPKVSLAVVIGFVIGKMSYKSACEEKILALSGGRLKESILSYRRAQSKLLGHNIEPDVSESPYAQVTRQDYSHSGPRSISELDTDRPLSSYDDSFNSFSDYSEEKFNFPITSPTQSMTYDELRKRNRDEYDSQRSRPRPRDDHVQERGTTDPLAGERSSYLQRIPSSETLDRGTVRAPVVTIFDDQPKAEISDRRSWHARQNQYGDVWDK